MPRSTRDGMVCPYRIVDDVGSGFCLGSLLGCFGFFIKGCVSSPRLKRFQGGINLVKKRAPALGGNFAAWMGLFGAFQCLLLSITHRDTHINQIIAGAMTGGIVSCRGGWRYMMRGAISGGIFIGLFNVIEIVFTKYTLKSQYKTKQIQFTKMALDQVQELRHVRPDLITVTDSELDKMISKVNREWAEMSGSMMLA